MIKEMSYSSINRYKNTIKKKKPRRVQSVPTCFLT